MYASTRGSGSYAGLVMADSLSAPLRFLRARHTARVENAAIADRLDAFASLLELAEANPYTIRAYRRAADPIRGTAAPGAAPLRDGRGRGPRGVGPGAGARARARRETGPNAGPAG